MDATMWIPMIMLGLPVAAAVVAIIAVEVRTRRRLARLRRREIGESAVGVIEKVYSPLGPGPLPHRLSEEMTELTAVIVRFDVPGRGVVRTQTVLTEMPYLVHEKLGEEVEVRYLKENPRMVAVVW